MLLHHPVIQPKQFKVAQINSSICGSLEKYYHFRFFGLKKAIFFIIHFLSTMHSWKAILKSKETVCCSFSWFKDLEIRAHLLTIFHMLGRPILEILFKSLFLTSKPQIKHITQQQKTSHGSICIFLEP